MPREIPWRKTLSAKLGGITLTLLAVSLVLLFGNLAMLSSIQGDSATINLFLKGRYYSYQLIYLANRLFGEENDQGRSQVKKELEYVVKLMDQRYEALEKGDPDNGVPAVSDPRILPGFNERNEQWRKEIKPALNRVAALAEKSSRQEARRELHSLGDTIKNMADEIVSAGEQLDKDLQKKVQWFQVLQYLFAAVVLIIIGSVLWVGRGITGRTRALASTADRISAGELALSVNVGGSDELAALGEAFNTMTGNLRTTIETEKESRARIEQLVKTEQQRRTRIEKLIESIREAVNRLSATSAEILATTTQQAAGAQQQAASVAQTVTTVNEVVQTAEQGAQRARSVGEAIQRTLETGKAGRKTVEDSITATDQVQEQVQATAENILALAEQAQAIGEIIATVNDIAEQTNLLALNAAIEASRAGEHGKGFSVVASEVKALADQSKKATAQVRQILGAIQKGTNTAVLSTEEVTRGVAAAKMAGQAGETIRALADTLAEAAQAAAQIVASAGQQATGMAQIHQAMKNIEQVAQQNLAAMRQAEQAAQNLNALGAQLAGLSAE